MVKTAHVYITTELKESMRNGKDLLVNVYSKNAGTAKKYSTELSMLSDYVLNALL